MPTRATVGENIGTTVVDSFLTDIANKKSANKAEIKRILLYLHSILKNHFGVMLEWLKRHAWKACNRQNRFGGSNPPHSASIGRHYDGRYFFICKRDLFLRQSVSESKRKPCGMYAVVPF